MAVTIIRKIFKYRLYPTKDQAIILDGHIAVCCELYNAALQERRDAYRLTRKSVSFRVQSGQLPYIKADRPDVGGVYSQVLQDALRRIDKAYDAFFRRVRVGQKPGFPRFRSLASYDSMTYPQSGFGIEGTHLKLTKVGRLKIKLHRPISGIVKTLTVKREAGKWFAYFSVISSQEPLPHSETAIGIDVGLTHFATLSDGQQIDNPRYFRNAQRRLKIAARKMSRRKKGSRRRRKALQLLQRVHAKIRNQRSNFHHQLSRSLVNTNGLIVVEDLNINGLANSMLAKSVKDAAWSTFITLIAYKAENAGRLLVKVDPRGTSQTCICGARVPKTLGQRWHECATCGLSAPRDHVSAHIILRLGLSLQAPRAT